jgi:hypothetical protein
MTTRIGAAAKAMQPVANGLEASILAQAAIDAADAHDLANNVHRVRLDDATVERAAEALWDAANPFVRWVNLSEPLRVDPRAKARAVLTAAVEGKP